QLYITQVHPVIISPIISINRFPPEVIFTSYAGTGPPPFVIKIFKNLRSLSPQHIQIPMQPRCRVSLVPLPKIVENRNVAIGLYAPHCLMCWKLSAQTVGSNKLPKAMRTLADY